MSTKCSVVFYTTKYRKGGDKFERAAATKYTELKKLKGDQTVLCMAIESKTDFLKGFENIRLADMTVDEFHFFGHSGMYGIMFGSVQWPEQFSPFEWRQMNLPTVNTSKFYFHACRSGRWFAPFISRTLNVFAFGYHNYTTVSLSPSHFVWQRTKDLSLPCYIIACPGKKSHGILASVKKYSGFMSADRMLEFEPLNQEVDTTYDTVSGLYESTFENIVVRSDELVWLEERLKKLRPGRILDLGCGNGAFLDKLSPNFEAGVGVDLSAEMLKQAQKRADRNQKLKFVKISGPEIPFADNSFDLVISTLAFRYLDWDPILSEILRVLKPGGRFLVLDMVTAPVQTKELFIFIKSKIKFLSQQLLHRNYYSALRKMVSTPQWQKMLHYNPIRSEHEMKWYLESRFSGQQAVPINIGWKSRILAFDSGEIRVKTVPKMNYP